MSRQTLRASDVAHTSNTGDPNGAGCPPARVPGARARWRMPCCCWEVQPVPACSSLAFPTPDAAWLAGPGRFQPRVQPGISQQGSAWRVLVVTSAGAGLDAYVHAILPRDGPSRGGMACAGGEHVQRGRGGMGEARAMPFRDTAGTRRQSLFWA